jgi:hypothetical protein
MVVDPLEITKTETISDQLRVILGKDTKRPLNLSVEDLGNPEMDSWTKANRADEKREPGPDKPILAKADSPSLQRRFANILQKMRRGMRDNEIVIVKDSKRASSVEATRYFKDQAYISRAESERKDKA